MAQKLYHRINWWLPSRRRINSIFGGNSSTDWSHCTRHSGHRSSRREWIISRRHRLQKVCWQGSTRALASNCSKQTGHSSALSNRSFNTSIKPKITSLLWSVLVTIWSSVLTKYPFFGSNQGNGGPFGHKNTFHLLFKSDLN